MTTEHEYLTAQVHGFNRGSAGASADENPHPDRAKTRALRASWARGHANGLAHREANGGPATVGRAVPIR